MKYTISDAAKILKLSRQTLYRHIDTKSISVEKNDNGTHLIDAAELIRVYGNSIDFDHLETPKNPPKSESTLTNSSLEDVVNLVKIEGENQHLKDKIAYLEEEKVYLRKMLDDERAERQKATLLLADLRRYEADKQADSTRELQDMEARFRTETLALRRKIKEEQTKFEQLSQQSFWRRLFNIS